jgi:hypothetical protein
MGSSRGGVAQRCPAPATPGAASVSTVEGSDQNELGRKQPAPLVAIIIWQILPDGLNHFLREYSTASG